MMTIPAEYIPILNTLFSSIAWIAKSLFFIVIVLSFKKMKKPKYLSKKGLIVDLIVNSLALFFILFMSGQWPHLLYMFISIILGMAIGILTAMPLRVFREGEHILSQGTNFYIILFAGSLFTIELLESFQVAVLHYFFLVALFSVALLYGASFHLMLRMKNILLVKKENQNYL